MTYALLKPSPRAAAKPARPARAKAASKAATKPDVGVTTYAADTHASAVQVQTKLTVGRPNDPLEHEADRVADAIVANLSQSARARRRHPTTSRATTPTKDTEPDTIHQKPAGPAPGIAKDHASHVFTAGSATAASVTSADTLQRACDECSEESDEVEIQRAPISIGAGTLQRSCTECSEDLAEEPQATTLPADTGDGTLQRSCAMCSEESEEELQRAPDAVISSQSHSHAPGPANHCYGPV